MKIKNWISKNCSRLDGKTICITGSTGGLAREFTKTLASLGANLIFANRNKEKSENQKQELLKLFPNIKIDIILVDLYNINSVKLFVCKLKLKHVDTIIFNSAIYNVPRQTSSIGFDNIFQVNFVSIYYIAKQMIPTLRKIKNSKIVFISSIAHEYSKVNFDDIQMLKNAKSSKIYGNSKRFAMFSLQKLLQDSSVELSVVHPGITLTNMTNHYPKAINWLVKLGIKILFPKPEKASLSIISGIYNSTKLNEWIGPAKFNIWGYPKKKNINSASKEEINRIYLEAEKIYDAIQNNL